jgi:Tol biopolymer transport system component
MKKLLAGAAISTMLVTTAVSAKNWGDWGPVSNISTLNTAQNDGCASLSPDGLELWFTSNRSGTLGATDIYVAERTSETALGQRA